jgi:hypothetical protein
MLAKCRATNAASAIAITAGCLSANSGLMSLTSRSAFARNSSAVAVSFMIAPSREVGIKSGVAPLHRAVRNRCAAAVRSLIEGGADPKAPNRNASTPMLLATLNTGKSGSGSPAAKEQQQEILCLLKKHGAT